MPISGPSFFPTFKALGGGAPDVTVPITQLCFDTSAGPPYQGWVWNYSIATWERFGGAGSGGFPTTENVNSTHAGVTLGNKNVSYITTDGTGTVNNVKLPIPAPDAGTLNAFWNTQWHVVVLKARTNAADTVAIDPRTVTITNSAFFDDVNEFYKAPEYLNSTIILGAVGDMAAFKWNGGQWVFDPDSVTDLSTVTPKVNTNTQLGIYGGGGNSYSHGGQGVFIAGGSTTYGTPATGGYVQLHAGTATTGNGGFIRLRAGYSYGNGGNIYAYGGGTAGAVGSVGGSINMKAGYGYHGGDAYISASNGSYYGGRASLYSGAGTTAHPLGAGGDVRIKSKGGYIGGSVVITTEQASLTGNIAGSISLNAGGALTGAIPGDIDIASGNGIGANCGNVFIEGGLQTGGTGVQKGGNIVIQTQFDNVVGDDIGSIAIQTGGTVASHANIGDIRIATGQNPISNPNTALQPGNGSIVLNVVGNVGSKLELAASTITVPDLPVVDPAIASALWINAGGFLVASGASGNFSGGGVTVNTAAEMISSSVNFTNGAGVGAGTLTNAPAAGNPTKWIGVNDNGVLRHVPAW